MPLKKNTSLSSEDTQLLTTFKAHFGASQLGKGALGLSFYQVSVQGKGHQPCQSFGGTELGNIQTLKSSPSK